MFEPEKIRALTCKESCSAAVSSGVSSSRMNIRRYFAPRRRDHSTHLLSTTAEAVDCDLSPFYLFTVKFFSSTPTLIKDQEKYEPCIWKLFARPFQVLQDMLNQRFQCDGCALLPTDANGSKNLRIRFKDKIHSPCSDSNS